MDRATPRACIEAFACTAAGPTGRGLAFARGLECGLRGTTASLATAGLVVLLVCGSPQASSAQTATVAALALVNDAPRSGLAVGLLPARPVRSSPPAEPATSMIGRVRALDTLLAVRGGRAGLSAGQTDASLAAAVARGSNRDLERRSGFQRRSNDVFRAQRSLQVGDEELVVRLRLRAKKRDTMSVEVRF